jgi:uncharacterized protein YecE (DUF72 family)
LRVGCSGWNYAHWRHGVFYPEGLRQSRWLAYYAERFDTVEVNSTFYRLPSLETVRHWAEQTPDGFTFAVKASRYLTHVKRLRDVEQGSERLLSRLRPLLDAGKLGPVLWQLPPNLERDDDLLIAALAALPETVEHAFEFRHVSWLNDDVDALLRRRNVALVVADRAGSPELIRREQTAKLVYVRFHAAAGNGNYTNAELGRWRRRLGQWARDRDVFAYFNNDWQGFAVENALVLRDGAAASAH